MPIPAPARMFDTSLLLALLILLTVSGIVFSFSVPDDYSDELISTSTITHTSPVPDDLPTKLQNVLVCETAHQWTECVAFLERHVNKDSEEYKQLQTLKDPYKQLRWHTLSLPIEATIRGYTELIKVMLRYGVPVNKKYASLGRTILHEAAQHGHDDLVIWLLTQGADINVKSTYNDTPLHVAVGHLHSNTAKLLLDAGADVNVVNILKATPLYRAVYLMPNLNYAPDEERAEINNSRYFIGKSIIEMLLEHGADTNIANYLGKTPLHDAAKYRNLTIVQMLTDGEANFNAIDIDNQTPLHEATESNNVPVVEYLITLGCDKTIIDTNNKTALDIAKEKNFTEIVDLLSGENE